MYSVVIMELPQTIFYFLQYALFRPMFVLFKPVITKHILSAEPFWSKILEVLLKFVVNISII